jgi:uridine phosphorylase
VDEGCLAVEMELAGVQAVCDFHGFALYDFLMTGDVLDQPEYSVAELHNANHSLDKFYLALEIALHI